MTMSTVLPPEIIERVEAWHASSPFRRASKSAALRVLIETGLDQLAPVASSSSSLPTGPDPAPTRKGKRS